MFILCFIFSDECWIKYGKVVYKTNYEEVTHESGKDIILLQNKKNTYPYLPAEDNPLVL